MLLAGNISASGLAAERLRMEVIANNIANSMATRTPGGGPFRRHDVVFEALMADLAGDAFLPNTGGLGGVRTVGVVEDQSDLPRIHQPGHPDADRDGFVTLPNVFLPIEMVNLMTASRAYEANLKVLQNLRQQLEQTLTLLRS
jgi:flagellar basal-body rod protein FlgC